MRLDKFLSEKYPKVSRAVFQKLIESGNVMINGATCENVRQNVSESDDVSVTFPKKSDFADEIAAFEKQVIYEDENVVVINKPAGILTHAKGGLVDEFTVADFIASKHKAGSQQLSERSGIVHRLDRGTSGVLIAAKNPAAQGFLQKQFQDRKTHKTYLALTEKAPKIEAARIDLPIGRNAKRPSEFRVDPSGKPAITDYKTLEIFGDGSALVELKPLTGRTHQLRVHLSHIKAPIIGDVVYNKNCHPELVSGSNNKTVAEGDSSPRMFLHAAELEITIPKIHDETANQRKIFHVSPPPDFWDEIARRRMIQ